MCLLIVKQSGAEYGKLSQAIRNGAYSNRDGFGFALKRQFKTEIQVRKDFTSAEDMITELEAQKIGKFDELMVHLRAATHGEASTGNAHPYAISRSSAFFLRDNFVTHMPVIGHNGIIHGYGTDKISDTYDYALKILADPSVMTTLMTNPEEVFKDANITKDLGWSRFCFMFPHRDMFWYGDRYIYEGILYSNTGFCGNGIDKDKSVYIPKGTTQSLKDAVDKAVAESTSKEVDLFPANTCIKALQDIGKSSIASCIKVDGEKVSIITRAIQAFIPNDEQIPASQLEPFLGDKVYGYIRDVKYSFESVRRIYHKILHLQNVANREYVFCEYLLPNVITTKSAIEFLEEDIKKRFSKEKLAELHKGIPQYLCAKDAGSVERRPGFDIVNGTLLAISTYPNKYILHAMVDFETINKGDEYIVSDVDNTSSPYDITLENVSNATRLQIALTDLCGRFRGEYNPDRVKQYLKAPLTETLPSSKKILDALVN